MIILWLDRPATDREERTLCVISFNGDLLRTVATHMHNYVKRKKLKKNLKNKKNKKKEKKKEKEKRKEIRNLPFYWVVVMT